MKSLQRIRMFIFFDKSIYKINRTFERILSLIIIKLILIKHSLIFKIIWLVDKWIIILIINIFNLEIINSHHLFLLTFCNKPIGLNNRQTRLRLDVVFNPMVKSIINNWAIRYFIFIIIALSQFMKSAQNFLFCHFLFCIHSLFFWDTPSHLPLPIISKILIKVSYMVYFLFNKFLRNTFRSDFMFGLLILSFMNFWNLLLILSYLRHPHLTKGIHYLINISFCFFSLMDILFLN